MTKTIVRAVLAQSLAPTMADSIAARTEYRQANPAAQPLASMYRTTAHRNAMRQLLDAVGLLGGMVKLAAFKECGELRYMLAQPVPGGDYTAKYVTVKDLELSERAGCPQYRRVCLDSITSMEVVYRAGN